MSEEKIKKYSIEQIDYVIEILKKEIKSYSKNNSQANEYRFGQTKTANYAIMLLEDARKAIKKYSVSAVEEPVEIEDCLVV